MAAIKHPEIQFSFIQNPFYPVDDLSAIAPPHHRRELLKAGFIEANEFQGLYIFAGTDDFPLEKTKTGNRRKVNTDKLFNYLVKTISDTEIVEDDLDYVMQLELDSYVDDHYQLVTQGTNPSEIISEPEPITTFDIENYDDLSTQAFMDDISQQSEKAADNSDTSSLTFDT
jgi:hypothetical protein